ncbi:hypothetical protein UCMB321_1968 [Pseudomonas batumici]|uniref:Uncharacterized protein n=1 Tax=Pseudomonas batumici TaxID=226910 RepID=A0A0C2EEJ8_9PSED|nr:hypothetical protein UCMB321_1968 [Pseudomonas batumici]
MSPGGDLWFLYSRFSSTLERGKGGFQRQCQKTGRHAPTEAALSFLRDQALWHGSAVKLPGTSKSLPVC